MFPPVDGSCAPEMNVKKKERKQEEETGRTCLYVCKTKVLRYPNELFNLFFYTKLYWSGVTQTPKTFSVHH